MMNNHRRKKFLEILLLCMGAVYICFTSDKFQIRPEPVKATRQLLEYLKNNTDNIHAEVKRSKREEEPPSSFFNLLSNREDYSLITESESNSEKTIKLNEFFSVVPVSSNNVFLIWPLEKPVLLFRYLCCVESWAFLHPNSTIWYIFTVDEVQDPGGIAKAFLNQYPNIKFIYSDIEKLFKGTPLESITEEKTWETSQWPGTQLADMMRQAILWHKGGYYSDTDVYAMANFYSARNFVSMSYEYDVKVLHNDAHHPWNLEMMKTIAETYDPEEYLTAGPKAAYTTARRVCGKDYRRHLGDVERNCTVDGHMMTFPHRNFCPYPCHKAFKQSKTPTLEEYLKDGAHCFHLCNSSSRRRVAYVGSESLMEDVAKKNCPMIYNQVTQYTSFW